MVDITLPVITSLIGMLFAIYFIASVIRKEKGTPKMQEISAAIHEGAMAYLRREYKTITIFAIIITIALGLFVNIPIANCGPICC